MVKQQGEKRFSLRRSLVRLLGLSTAGIVLSLVLMVGCQGNFIYFPRPYEPETVTKWQRMSGGRVIDFETSQGRQKAFLQGKLESPRNLWIICGGNGSVALDWANWLETNAPQQDAWLLVDFPGYGDCEGSPTPRAIQESMRAVVPAACSALGWSTAPDSSRLRIFGHSLGAAACLLAATEFEIQRGVLLAPFTSTMEMSRVVTGLPLGFAVWHRYDNAARLADLAARGHGKIIILHGTDDEAIPVEMGRFLAADQPEAVQIREIQGGRHNTIPSTHPEILVKALLECGE